jgi:hypothetical protein
MVTRWEWRTCALPRLLRLLLYSQPPPFLRWQINLNGVLLLPDQETIRTPFGTRTATTLRNMLCLDNAPLVREAARYTTSAQTTKEILGLASGENPSERRHGRSAQNDFLTHGEVTRGAQLGAVSPGAASVQYVCHSTLFFDLTQIARVATTNIAITKRVRISGLVRKQT